MAAAPRPLAERESLPQVSAVGPRADYQGQEVGHNGPPGSLVADGQVELLLHVEVDLPPGVEEAGRGVKDFHQAAALAEDDLARPRQQLRRQRLLNLLRVQA